MLETLERCLECEEDLSAYHGGRLPDFCPRCQLPLRLIGDGYRFERKLGQGGFGTVYKARHIGLDTVCAIKLLRQDLDSIIAQDCSDEDRARQKKNEFLSRFRREVRITSDLSRVSHHIVRSSEIHQDPVLGAYYIMEFLEGTMLNHYINSRESVDVVESFLIFRQLCEAMATAHENGVIHRDLKPANVFLLPDPERGLFVKVIDFGIAKALQGTVNLDLTTGILGTPTYIAPEQCKGLDSDHRTDIYSMGCLCYHLLTGTPPFTKEGMALLFAHAQESPEPLRSRSPELEYSKSLDKAVLKALSKEPGKRYQDVASFWQALEPEVPEEVRHWIAAHGDDAAFSGPEPQITPSSIAAPIPKPPDAGKWIGVGLLLFLLLLGLYFIARL